MKPITIITVTALIAGFVLTSTTVIGMPIPFTGIKDATSGNEPDLYSVLNQVAPEYNWGNTDYLNSGAGGRRINDFDDTLWYSTGREISITMLATYWGGSALPADNLGQEIVYDLDSSDGRNVFYPTPRVDSPGQSSTIQLTRALTEIAFGDESGNPTAWTDSLANTAFGNGVLDRVVTFDVQGLDIYAWSDSSFQLVQEDAGAGSFILAFDPGSDQDYQDLLVLIEGVQVQIPEPASCSLMVLGGLLLIRRRRR